jgi:hypothetical protein
MFVQVIKGKAADPEGLQRHADRWADEVRPGAKGFAGSTYGVTDDGTFFVAARFEDEAAAQANAERSEQTAWWEQAQQYIDGEPSFRESSDTHLLFDGGSDEAGFVQVMEGKARDRAKAEAMETPEMLQQLRTARPDLLGGLRVWFDEGEYVEIAYFTSEDEARKNETTGEFSGPQEEFASLFGEPTYLDLEHPHFAGPA